MTRNTRKRIVIAAALATVALSLLLTVGASARNGHRSHARAHAAPARSHASQKATARKDGGNDGQGDDEDRVLLSSTLAGSLQTDPLIHGVKAGGAPWALSSGSVRLKADGSIRVEVEGLVIPVAHGTFPAGTALPVTTISASLYCAPDTATAAANTKAVPITPAGDAEIADTITLPATCLSPTVLVHPNGGAAAYIAANGWR